MIEQFSLERVNRAPAAFDPAKLAAFEEHYMQELPLDEKVDMVLPYLEATLLLTLPPTEEDRSYVESIVRAAGDRIKVAGDIIDYADFFTPDDQLLYDQTAFEKRLQKPDEAAGLLAEYRDRLAVLDAFDAFDAESLETDLRSFAEEKGIKIGQIIHAVRSRSPARRSVSGCSRRWRSSARSAAWPASTGRCRSSESDRRPSSPARRPPRPARRPAASPTTIHRRTPPS